MLKLILPTIFFSVFLFSSAHAVRINDFAFRAYGGDPNKPDETYRIPYLVLTYLSQEPSFMSAGRLSGNGYSCSGTWIGDSKDRQYIWVLTAAHCLSSKKITTGAIRFIFLDYQNRVIGRDGVFFIPPQRMQVSNNGTDIGILRLKKEGDIRDLVDKPIPAPMLNDMGDEKGNRTYFVGHGYWGTRKGGEKPKWGPEKGQRRALGQSVVDKIDLDGTRLITTFDGSSERWAGTGSGDSGMGVWQSQDSHNYYGVGVHSGGNNSARVSAYARWIESQAPGVVKWRSSTVDKDHACFLMVSQSGQWAWILKRDDEFGPLDSKTRCLRRADRCNAPYFDACFKWAPIPK